jgi:hypothetical protein
VARVQSKQLFLIQTQDGSVYTGALDTAAPSADTPVTFEVVSTETRVTIARSHVVRVEQTSTNLLRRMSGSFNLGVVYSKGNNATQYTLGSEVEYLRDRWGLSAILNSNLSASSGADTSTRNQLTLKGWRRLPWNNYFYSGLGTFLQSSVQGIDRQNTIGGGIGRFFKNTNRARISLLAGLAWQDTGYKSTIASIERQEVYGGLIGSEIKFFLFKKTNLSLTSTLVPAISERGRLYFDTNAAYYLKVFKNLNWNFSFYGNWDTRPPQHFTGADYGYSSGVKWTFGNR